MSRRYLSKTVGTRNGHGGETYRYTRFFYSLGKGLLGLIVHFYIFHYLINPIEIAPTIATKNLVTGTGQGYTLKYQYQQS